MRFDTKPIREPFWECESLYTRVLLFLFHTLSTTLPFLTVFQPTGGRLALQIEASAEEDTLPALPVQRPTDFRLSSAHFQRCQTNLSTAVASTPLTSPSYELQAGSLFLAEQNLGFGQRKAGATLRHHHLSQHFLIPSTR